MSMTPPPSWGVKAATPLDAPDAETLSARRRWWWLSLVSGVFWIVVALVVLQFDQASVTTVGVIVGAMFAVTAVEQFALAFVAESHRWLWALFGALFVVAAIIAFINPKATFAGLADVLGFLFLTVGVWWTIRAFIEKDADPLWWLGLTGGVLMIVLAFWTSGQFFIQRAYTLLVFAGIWALMQGVTAIVRAYQLRRLPEDAGRAAGAVDPLPVKETF